MEIVDIKNKFKICDLLIDNNKDNIKDIEKFNCLICCESFFNKEILQCREGHYYCYGCWNKSLSLRSECMGCRLPVNSINDLSRCRFFEAIFLGKKVYCPYVFKNITDYLDSNAKLLKDSKYGCKDIVRVEDLDTHIMECKYKFVKCPNSGCSKVFRLNQHKTHQECPFEITVCKYCSERVTLSSIKSHYSSCSSMYIKCTQCPIRLKRSALAYHIDNECSNTVIQCTYKEGGCSGQFKRSELSIHLEKVNHGRYFNDLVAKLESDLKDSNLKYDQLLKRLQSIEITLDGQQQQQQQQQLQSTYQYSNDWIISNFSSIQLNRGEFLTSPVISIGNYKFELFIYLNMSKEYMDSLSLFIREVNKSPVLIKFQFKIINNINSSNNIIKQFKKKLEGEYQAGLGYPNLLSKKITSIENGWLTLDDKLKIEFKIKIKPSIKSLISNQ